MKWLCKIGIHKYRPFGYNSLVLPLPILRCDRCGKGVQYCMGYTNAYTKEQLEAAAREFLGKVE